MNKEPSLRIGIDTLFESPATGTGGLVYIRNIVKALAEVANGDRLYLFTSPSNAYLFEGLPGNLSIIRSGWSNEQPLRRIFSQQVIIPFLARKLDLDILLCPGNVLPLAVRLPRVLVLQNRLLFDLPKEHGFLRRHYRRLMGKLSLNSAATIVPVSHDLDDYLQKTFKLPEGRKVVVPAGVDEKLFRRRNGSASPVSKDANLLVVGELWPYKNHELLLRVLAQCPTLPRISPRLVFVGGDWKGRREHLECLARDWGVVERITFLGRIPHEKMPEIYTSASVLLYPSLAECFPLPVFEAMACGVPVITSNCASFPELVGDAGLCLDPYDEEAWKNAIDRVLTDTTFRDSLIERGLARVKTYTWSSAGSRLLQVLRATAQSHKTH
jgi:glycosyltransferase involved in cell wall biosynthesis